MTSAVSMHLVSRIPSCVRGHPFIYPSSKAVSSGYEQLTLTPPAVLWSISVSLHVVLFSTQPCNVCLSGQVDRFRCASSSSSSSSLLLPSFLSHRISSSPPLTLLAFIISSSCLPPRLFLLPSFLLFLFSVVSLMWCQRGCLGDRLQKASPRQRMAVCGRRGVLSGGRGGGGM